MWRNCYYDQITDTHEMIKDYIRMAFWWLYGIYHGDIETDRVECCYNNLSAAMNMTPFIMAVELQHFGPWEM